MKKNQTLTTSSGVEVILFPLDVFINTQAYSDNILWLSHEGTKALDLCGTHSQYPIYMPVTAKCLGKYDLNNGNGVLWESVDKVLFADGTIDYCHFVFWHDNNINDFAIGSVWKQGQECQDTGVSGIGTGDHIHIEFGKGKAPDLKYPLINTGHTTHFSNGRNIPTYSLRNACRPEDAMFINDTVIKNNQFNLKFKTYKESDYMKNGWIWDDKLKEQTYYENGIMFKNKWVESPKGSNEWYWLKDDGRMARTEVLVINGKERVFWKSGMMASIDNTVIAEDKSLYRKQ